MDSSPIADQDLYDNFPCPVREIKKEEEEVYVVPECPWYDACELKKKKQAHLFEKNLRYGIVYAGELIEDACSSEMNEETSDRFRQLWKLQQRLSGKIGDWRIRDQTPELVAMIEYYLVVERAMYNLRRSRKVAQFENALISRDQPTPAQLKYESPDEWRQVQQELVLGYWMPSFWKTVPSPSNKRELRRRDRKKEEQDDAEFLEACRELMVEEECEGNDYNQ